MIITEVVWIKILIKILGVKIPDVELPVGTGNTTLDNFWKKLTSGFIVRIGVKKRFIILTFFGYKNPPFGGYSVNYEKEMFKISELPLMPY